MNILIIGYGRMGRLIAQTAPAGGDAVAAAVDLDNIASLKDLGRAADVVMDFSNPAALAPVEDYIRRTGTPLLSGTTGFSEEQMARLRALGAYAPVLHSGNYSLGRGDPRDPSQPESGRAQRHRADAPGRRGRRA